MKDEQPEKTTRKSPTVRMHFHELEMLLWLCAAEQQTTADLLREMLHQELDSRCREKAAEIARVKKQFARQGRIRPDGLPILKRSSR